jgi:2-polyprenyl-3-methyl-5-hydroxy-6-metoxy-1,4-benzoquinol methylase
MLSRVNLVHVRCSTCGADDAQTVGQGTDHEYHSVADIFRMVRCRACGLVYMDPRPDTSALDVIYPTNYYAYELARKRVGARGTDAWLARYMRRKAARALEPFVGRVRETARDVYRILDVGCGDGTKLAEWQDAFGDARVETSGVEMNAEAATIARAAGHDVVSARVEEARLPRQGFDLIYSFHVIEHVEDPVAFMVAVHDAVRPTGYVLLDTPNVDTVDYRLFATGSWGAYHFPRHFTLYTPATMRALAEKTGFDVLQISFAPSAIFWVWTLHALLEKRAPRLADALFPPVEIFTRASPWNVGLLAAFTVVDRGLIAATGRCSQMRILLRPRA